MLLKSPKALLFCLLIFTNTYSFGQSENAKPWVFWYWMQAGVSKEGITADLEAMKANGIGGAYLMPIKGASTPPIYTPVAEQLSPRWWEMFEFSLREAQRLQLKIGMHVSDGFALAGGPWITPAMSMQKLVSTKINVTSTVKNIVLPKPESKENYYEDIAVYAYPSQIGANSSTRNTIPVVTTSNGVDASGLIKPDNKQNFGSSEPCYIQYAFAAPFTCRTVTIRTSGNNYQAERLEIQVSNDGKNFRSIGRLEPPRHGWQDTDEDFTNSIVPTTAKYFRFVFDKTGSEAGSEDLDAAKWKPSLKVRNIELFSAAQIHQYEGKNGSVWRVSKRTTEQQIADDACVPLAKIINLTSKLKADGTLDWKVPAGNWTILRVGHTSTGHTNATGGKGSGLECDKFNPEAIKLQFNSWYGEALKHAGSDFSPGVLSVFHVDSWECGSQNWSSVFKQEFQKRRGYDLTPYLPIMTGLPVQSVKVSENFLYDVRQTISELVVDAFYKTVAAMAKEKGLTFTAESVAPTMMSDGLLHYKTVDVPMGEFWNNSPTHDKPNDMFDAISGAHIYGKNTILAEAFTTVRMDWNESPMNLKALQDRNYALGINKLTYHVFTHNPWLNRKPGMTLDGVGIYFQRDQTWWKLGKAWVDYATRSQELLQQGKPVVDVAVFTGEELPRRSVLPDRLVSTLPGVFGEDVQKAEEIRLKNEGQPTRQLPAGVTHSANMADPENWVNPLRGYAYDSFNPDAFSTATVKNGKVVFASGASYSVLVFTGKLLLNPNDQYVRYETVKKLHELIILGAKVIVADRPIYQAGLKQVNDKEFNDVISAIWGGKFESVLQNGQQIQVKKMGKGKVFKAPFYGADFTELGLERDLYVQEKANHTSEDYAKKLAYTHRQTAQKDIYFISNQEDKERILEFSFRVAGKIPVLYDAVSNTNISLKEWKQQGNRTIFSYCLAANQSIFVLFEKATNQEKQAAGSNVKRFKNLEDISFNWEVKFDASLGGPENPVVFKELIDWSKYPDTNINYYSGTAFYSKDFIFSQNPERVWIDLGAFSSMAEVRINGQSCGILWTPPYRLDISKALKKGKNKIEIELVNTWGNRLIGDSKLPENKRITNTTAPFRLADKPLYASGLLGPVRIQQEEN
ncbi:glycosyl hydrolase [Pedobacter sp. MW01-1-1]|uniref:glycosyl hydrolase n=1 Tax=Pedobacter sp. MW01-1-1 TaxID=3383027 RepID=UPI003FF07AC7